MEDHEAYDREKGIPGVDFDPSNPCLLCQANYAADSVHNGQNHDLGARRLAESILKYMGSVHFSNDEYVRSIQTEKEDVSLGNQACRLPIGSHKQNSDNCLDSYKRFDDLMLTRNCCIFQKGTPRQKTTRFHEHRTVTNKALPPGTHYVKKSKHTGNKRSASRNIPRDLTYQQRGCRGRAHLSRKQQQDVHKDAIWESIEELSIKDCIVVKL